MITYNILNKYTEIAHFCTTRQGGTSVGNYASLNLSPFSGDNDVHFNENLNLLAKHLNIDTEQIIIPFQNHGVEIREIDTHFFNLTSQKKNDYLNGVDALITQFPNICLGITTADCVPLLFYDPEKRVIAAAHAGWRGTCGRIVQKTVRSMVEIYNCQPKNIRVTIGPSISVAMYEVGQEVANNFEVAGFDLSRIVTTNDNSLYLDLWKANQLQLEEEGILNEHIEISGICTFTEHNRFFSARKLGIKSGRMLSGILLKKKK